MGWSMKYPSQSPMQAAEHPLQSSPQMREIDTQINHLHPSFGNDLQIYYNAVILRTWPTPG